MYIARYYSVVLIKFPSTSSKFLIYKEKYKVDLTETREEILQDVELFK
jgi:hypothetical protein